MRKFLGILVLAGCMIAATGHAETTGQPATANAKRLLDLINGERKVQGCGPLRMDDRLVQAADRHSLDMVTEQFFDHVAPDGSTPQRRVDGTGYRSVAVTENIQISSGVLEDVADIGMDTPSLRDNLLNCAYSEIGIAARVKVGASITVSGRPSADSFYWTQVLAEPEPVAVVNASRSTQKVFELINAERAKHGCAPLNVETRLTRAAERESQDMVDRHFFNHTAPDGATPGSRVKGTGYVYQMVGENIEVNTYNPEEVVKTWMNSPGHRENILMCAFRETGIAVAYQADDEQVAGVPGVFHAYWTQVFAMPLNLGK